MKNVIVEAAQITSTRNSSRWITNRRVMVVYLGFWGFVSASERQRSLHELRDAAFKRFLACPSTGSGCTAAWYFPIYSVFRFLRASSAKTETQKKKKCRSAEG